ncbi:MAG: HPr family phosphocarrier protein [Bilifractor sp.]|jgi:phosphotransferase system HPr (HPr) family protein
MVRQNVTVSLSGDFKTRPVAMLVQLASQFQSQIHLESENHSVNAKSIMGMMALGLTEGDNITVTADGSDEAVALEKITAALTAKE